MKNSKNQLITVGILLLVVLWTGLMTSCSSKPDKPMSKPDLVLKTLKEKYGLFSDYNYSQDSAKSFHTYRWPEMKSINDIKGTIDKTVNAVGVEHKGGFAADLGEYTWESPTEKITMGAGIISGSDSIYVNVWIDRK